MRWILLSLSLILTGLWIGSTGCSGNSGPVQPSLTPTPTPNLDNFDGPAVKSFLTWLDPMGDTTYSFAGGKMQWDVPQDRSDWPGGAKPAPMLGVTVTGNFWVETRVTVTGSQAAAGLVAVTGSLNQDLSQWVAGITGTGNDQAMHQILGSGTWWTGSLTLVDNSIWYRLIREGNIFYSYYSTDGVNWPTIHVETSAAPSTLFVGIRAVNPVAAGLTTYSPQFDYFGIKYF